MANLEGGEQKRTSLCFLQGLQIFAGEGWGQFSEYSTWNCVCVARPYSDLDRIFFAVGWELMSPLVPFCVTTVHHSEVILLYFRQWGAIKNLD